MIQRFDSEITAVTGQTIDASSETSRMEFKLQYRNLRAFLRTGIIAMMLSKNDNHVVRLHAPLWSRIEMSI